MYVLKVGNTIYFPQSLQVASIILKGKSVPNVKNLNTINKRNGYLIAKISKNNNGQPTSPAMEVMNSIQNRSVSKTKLSPNTPPQKKRRRK